MTGLLVKIETAAEAVLTNIETDGAAALQGLEGVVKAEATAVGGELEQAIFSTLETFGEQLFQQILGMLTPGATVTVPTPAPASPPAAQDGSSTAT